MLHGGGSMPLTSEHNTVVCRQSVNAVNHKVLLFCISLLRLLPVFCFSLKENKMVALLQCPVAYGRPTWLFFSKVWNSPTDLLFVSWNNSGRFHPCYKWFIFFTVFQLSNFLLCQAGLIEMGCHWEKGLQLYILIIWV